MFHYGFSQRRAQRSYRDGLLQTNCVPIMSRQRPLELFENAISSGLLLVATIVESSAMTTSGAGIIYSEWPSPPSGPQHAGGTRMTDTSESVRAVVGIHAKNVGAAVDSTAIRTTTSSEAASATINSTSSLNSSMNATVESLRIINGTLNVTLNGTLQDSHCHDWQPTQHTLFQVANLCYFCAFLVPHNFRLNMLLVRCILCLGFILFTVWAGVFICAPDILAWNLALMSISIVHVAYLGHQHFPVRLRPEYAELYTRLFKPLKVDKRSFDELLREAQIHALDEDQTYAVEDVTSTDERLSILLTGKLKVTCEDTHLHYILPNQFLDSPEWEAFPTECGELFQVTVTAVEPSRYVCWSRSRLRTILRNKPLLDSVIYNLVGKDITQKLYSLNEHLNPYGGHISSGPQYGGGGPSRGGGWKPNQRFFPRSFSVDVVHTGTKGHVRSHLWKLHSRALPFSKKSETPEREIAEDVSASGTSSRTLDGVRSTKPRVHFPPQKKVKMQVLVSTMDWLSSGFRRVHHHHHRYGEAADQSSSSSYERYPLWNRLPSPVCKSPSEHSNNFAAELRNTGQAVDARKIAVQLESSF